MEAKATYSNQHIIDVQPDSIGACLGIQPGDRLLKVNGQTVQDVFAYRLAMMEAEVELTIQTTSGEVIVFEIEKEEHEDLGLTFQDALMDDSRHCHNKCMFCFIDQLPKGMRETLYFKDDDMRLSFLTGNYITLTNLSDAELDRLLTYHLSPMNISVHATDPVVRRRMLKNPRSERIMEQLHRIIEAGIEINCQIVLCPGVNDGDVLDRTLADLSTFGNAVLSIAVVPVGITKFRAENRLEQVKRFNCETAGRVIDQTAKWQDFFLKKHGRRVFFAADEFYIRAERPVPIADEYEDMPQLENGVGMLALFKEQMRQGLSDRQLDYDATYDVDDGTAAINQLRDDIIGSSCAAGIGTDQQLAVQGDASNLDAPKSDLNTMNEAVEVEYVFLSEDDLDQSYEDDCDNEYGFDETDLHPVSSIKNGWINKVDSSHCDTFDQADLMLNEGSSYQRSIPEDIYVYDGADEALDHVHELTELDWLPPYAHVYTPQGIFDRYDQAIHEVTQSFQPIHHVHVFTGVDAADWIRQFKSDIETCYKFKFYVHAVVNEFFGETITVAGLLTGQDLLKAAQKIFCDLDAKTLATHAIILPDCMFKQTEAIFLDDLTPMDLVNELGIDLLICRDQGRSLLYVLDEIQIRNEAIYE